MTTTVQTRAQYLDASSHARWPAAIFAYCDTAGCNFWSSISRATDSSTSAAVLADMQSTAAENALMRANVVILNEPYASILRRELLSEQIYIEVRLVAVGITSYTLLFRLRWNDQLLATVETVMVNTDATHTRSAPLPHASALRGLVQERTTPPLITGVTAFVPPGEGRDVALWRSVVRATDCDHYGHVNNALYPLLCEEARAAHASSGEYAGRALACATWPAIACSVNHIGQAMAFQTLEIASHMSGGAFHFEVRSASRVVAHVVLVVAAADGLHCGAPGMDAERSHDCRGVPAARARL